jgi:hypothetical protein
VLADAAEYLGAVVLRKVKVKQDQTGAGGFRKVLFAAEKRQRLFAILGHFQIERHTVLAEGLLDEIHIGGVIFRQENSG